MIFGFPFKFSLLRILEFPSNTGYVCGVLVKSSQVTFIYIAFFTIQIVSKQLHSDDMN